MALLRQTKKEWDENLTSISKICVCSETDISQTDDSIQDNLYELSGKVSTNSDEIQEFYRMSFKEAIDKNILVDYQIIAVGVSDHELAEAIEQRKYIKNHISIDDIANNYTLEKIMKQHDSTHALTFHSSVTKAEAFKKRHSELYPEINTYHVNGAMTTNEREKRLREFKQDNKAIVTNARCLTEGVDIPAIDLVYFCDPKNSKIDIVQAAGRALRRDDHKNKKMGYIVVPIFHKEKEHAEEMIESSPFKNLIAVIRALSAHDERLVEEITNIKDRLGKRKIHSSHFSLEVTEKVIALVDFEETIKYSHSLQFKSSSEWKTFAKSSNKPANIPAKPDSVYKNLGWISWQDWLGTSSS